MVVSLCFFLCFVFKLFNAFLMIWDLKKELFYWGFLSLLHVWDTAGNINFIWKLQESQHVSSARTMRNSSESWKHNEKPRRKHHTSFQLFNFFKLSLTFSTILGPPYPSLGGVLRSEHITLVHLCSPDWLSEVGPASYVVSLLEEGGTPQIVKQIENVF